jgi:hypothetical protein
MLEYPANVIRDFQRLAGKCHPERDMGLKEQTSESQSHLAVVLFYK